MLRAVLLCLALLPALVAVDEAPPPELPASVQRLFDTHAKGMDRAQGIYLKEAKRLDGVLLKALEREKSRAMRAEKLELALAIDAKIKEIVEAEPTVDILGRPIKGKVVPVEQRLCARPWKGTVPFLGDFVFRFAADGTYAVTNREGMRGTWRHDAAKKVVLVKMGGAEDVLRYKDTDEGWIYDKKGVGPIPFAPIAEEPKAED